MRVRNAFYLMLREVGIGVALVLMIVVFSALAPRFASVDNLTNTLTPLSSNSRTIFEFPDAFNEIGSASVIGVPVIFLMALAIVLAGRFVLLRTVFGRMIYAIGNNEEAVRLSGHTPSLYKVAAFTVCGGMV